MHKRLKNWIELMNLKPSELADNIGANRATISHILSGRNKPSIDFLEKLLSKYESINANWLITGRGDRNVILEKTEINESKKISRVLVFYDDKSFDEVNS